MKVRTFTSEQEWLDARKGKITGTRAGSLVSKRDLKPLKGYYELIAERVAIPVSEENPMERGKRLEEEALERFAEETGKKVKNDLVLWEREDNPDIALSPDGTIGKTEAVEVKCLSSASHIEAWLTKKVPSEYEFQVLQYFIVNDLLKKLYFVLYDPRMPVDFFYIEVTREQMQEEIDRFLAVEQSILKDIAEIESKLTF